MRASALAALLLLAPLLASCDSDDNRVTCTSSCSDRDFEIEGETGTSLFEVECETSFDYPGGSRRVTSESCSGTRTYSQSGRSYKFTSQWDQVSCHLTIEVESVGKCTAP
jgi:hypothetical protein